MTSFIDIAPDITGFHTHKTAFLKISQETLYKIELWIDHILTLFVDITPFVIIQYTR